MDFLLRAVEHLSVGTFELLHQLRNNEKNACLYLSSVQYQRYSFRSKDQQRMENKEVHASEIHDPLDPRTLAN